MKPLPLVLLALAGLAACDKKTPPPAPSPRPEAQAPAAATGRLEKRRRALLEGPLSISIGLARPQVEEALAAEAARDYARALRAWESARGLLKAANEKRPPSFEPFEKRPFSNLPELLDLDLGRTRWMLLGAGAADDKALDAAEGPLQAFYVAAYCRKDQETPGASLRSTAAQEPAVLEAMAACEELLGEIQARRASQMAAWPAVHIIEDLPFASRTLGPLRARLVSPVARVKEQAGPKYVGIWFGSEEKARLLIKLYQDGPVVWSTAGLDPAMRKEQAALKMVSLREAGPEAGISPVSLSICWTPFSGNVEGYGLSRTALTFQWGGD
ncbi:MAG TPA: hypothetical protein VK188_05095 [Holophaga sp.]|nr:hypothetical protein [Holophaga sp.]